MEGPAGRQQQPGLEQRRLAVEPALRQRWSDAPDHWERMGGLERAVVRLGKLPNSNKCYTFEFVMETYGLQRNSSSMEAYNNHSSKDTSELHQHLMN
eukprot:3222169-Heterocapsa_arctica.AAC.1